MTSSYINATTENYYNHKLMLKLGNKQGSLFAFGAAKKTGKIKHLAPQ